MDPRAWTNQAEPIFVNATWPFGKAEAFRELSDILAEWETDQCKT